MSEVDSGSFEHQEEMELSFEVASILRKLGEDFGFDEETCREVALMPFDDAFEAAYGYLTQAGLDADEVLSSFFDPTA